MSSSAPPSLPLHKEVLLLGLLQSGPQTGYAIHRIVVAHGELYTDLKKSNVYYLLDRLATLGYVQVAVEGGARGPRRERLVYTLTEPGRQRFRALLREVVRTYDVMHTGIEVGMVFLPYLDTAEAWQLLAERRQAIVARRALVAVPHATALPLAEALAYDHLISLMEAEIAWVERALHRLRTEEGPTSADAGCPGMHASDTTARTVSATDHECGADEA